MGQSDAERRAYARGYNSGVRRRGTLVRALIEIAKGYRARLTDIDTARQCQTCDRWERGHSSTLWGYCRADFDADEPRMWADRFVGDRPDRQIVTHEHFGCVNWIPLIRRRP